MINAGAGEIEVTANGDAERHFRCANCGAQTRSAPFPAGAGALVATTNQPSGDREHQELLMLYGMAINEVARVKQQQWRTFYAAILAQAALATSLHLDSTRNLLSFHPVKWTIGWLVFLGVCGLAVDQHSLRRLRKLVKEDYAPRLERRSQELLKGKNADDRTRWFYPWAMGISFALASYLCWLIANGHFAR